MEKREGKKLLFYPSWYLVVQHHHITRVSTQPRVDGLAHAADLVQCRCVMVRPAKLHHLGRTGRQEKEVKKEDVRGSDYSTVLMSRIVFDQVLALDRYLCDGIETFLAVSLVDVQMVLFGGSKT